MKQLNIYFDDGDFSKLKKLKKKNNQTWRELFLTVLEVNQNETRN